MLEEHVIQKQWFTGVPEGTSLFLSTLDLLSWLSPQQTRDVAFGVAGMGFHYLLPSLFSRIAKSSLSHATLLPKTLCGLAICLKIFKWLQGLCDCLSLQLSCQAPS